MNQVSLDQQGRLVLTSETIRLRSGLPVINGKVREDWQAQVTGQGESFTVHYSLPDSGSVMFGVEVHNPRSFTEPGWLRFWVADLPEEVELDSFGLHFSAVENVAAYLRHGYQSWDGSYYIRPETIGKPVDEPGGTVMGYALAQFLPRYGSENLVTGFDRHDRFQQTFTFTHNRPLELTIETWWDRKDRHGLARCESERLLFFSNAEVEAGLSAWAMQVAKASLTKPRVDGPAITGWCSWYNLYAYINEENLLEHLQNVAAVARRANLPMRVFQIDDGFTPEMGDWLEVKPQFPRGMGPILDDIRAAGFVAGLWIAPFMVGNRSRLYREHPDWVVRDRETGGPLVQYSPTGCC